MAVGDTVQDGLAHGQARIRAIRDDEGIAIPASVLSGNDPSGQTSEVAVDAENRALVTIDSVHAAIHEGVAFRAGYIANLAPSASTIMRLSVGANNDAHVLFEIVASLACSIEVREGSTFSAPGSALDEVNLNRESSTVADVVAYEDPTVTTPGALLLETIIPAGSNVNQGGGQAVGSREEWVLDKSTEYTIELTNTGNQTVDFALAAVWYER